MSKRGSDENVVRSMKLNLIVGMIGAVFFAIIWYFSIKEEGWGAWGFHVVCGFFVLLGIVLMLRYLAWRITYNETEFTVRNIFGISHTYRYSQITARESGVQVNKLWIGKKKIELEAWSEEALRFYLFARDQYEKLAGDPEGIPEDWPKNDIFRGNIEGGMLIFIIEVIVLCLGVGLGAFLLFNREYLDPEQYPYAILIALLLVLPSLFLVIGSVIVGRHPERYSRKIVKLFFKEQYVRIYRKEAELQDEYDSESGDEQRNR